MKRTLGECELVALSLFRQFCLAVGLTGTDQKGSLEARRRVQQIARYGHTLYGEEFDLMFKGIWNDYSRMLFDDSEPMA